MTEGLCLLHCFFVLVLELTVLVLLAGSEGGKSICFTLHFNLVPFCLLRKRNQIVSAGSKGVHGDFHKNSSGAEIRLFHDPQVYLLVCLLALL